MLEVVELIKAAHFIIFFSLIFTLSIWIKEEFITIFNRKRIAGLGLLKVLIVKTISEENGYHQEVGRSKLENIALYLCSILGALLPLLYFQLADPQTILDMDLTLGIINVENSWLFIFYILITGELIRGYYEKEFMRTSLKVPLLLLLLITFYEVIPSFSVEQFIQYQKSFGESGLRNYLLFKNPIGLIVFALIIFLEIRNPNEEFSLINNLYLNTYILLFVFSFLGGYGLPSVLSESDFVIGSKIIILQTISLLAKYFFCLILVWVLKYSLIKETRRTIYGN